MDLSPGRRTAPTMLPAGWMIRAIFFRRPVGPASSLFAGPVGPASSLFAGPVGPASSLFAGPVGPASSKGFGKFFNVGAEKLRQVLAIPLDGLAQTLLEADFGIVAEQIFGLADIGERIADVSRARRFVDGFRAVADDLAEHLER